MSIIVHTTFLPITTGLVLRLENADILLSFLVEVCMGMGIPLPMGFPWDSHRNGSSFGLLMGMGMGMGIVLMGMGMAYFIGEKINSHPCSVTV